jgi:hypothetical protein
LSHSAHASVARQVTHLTFCAFDGLGVELIFWPFSGQLANLLVTAQPYSQHCVKE